MKSDIDLKWLREELNFHGGIYFMKPSDYHEKNNFVKLNLK